MLLLFASGVCAAKDAAGVGDSLGIWSDDTTTFAFLKNNQLQVWGKKYVQRPGTKHYERIATMAEGVWEAEDDLCWLGNKTEKGNLMLYIGQLQCCMSIKTIGGKLVASKVWAKNRDPLDLCEDRLLTRKSNLPDLR